MNINKLLVRFKGETIALFAVVSIIIAFLFFPLSSVGNDESFSFHHYTNEDGLPSSYVKSITQDKYGFIWLATRITISRFDGKKFKEFPAYDEFNDPIEVFSNKLFLYADSILIARSNIGRYYYFDYDQECFKDYGLLNKIGITQAVSQTIGGYWVCRDNNLYFLNEKTGRLKALREKLPFVQIPGNINFLSVLVRGDDIIALTDRDLLIWINTRELVFKSYDIPDNHVISQVQLYYIDSEKQAWIGDEITGLSRINLTSGDFQRYTKDEKGNNYVPHNLVHCFTEDSQKRIWIGTEAGIAILDPETNTNTFCRYESSNPDGLNTDPIYDAFCDKDGNIWLGTYFGGINFWSAEKSFFRTWNAGVGKWQLGGNVVSCLTEDQEGNLWIGLEDMGLNKLNVKTGNVTKYTSGNGDSGLSYNNLHDLLFVSDSCLWIASYTGGINILNTNSGKFKHLNIQNVSKLPSNNVYSFLQVGDSVFISTTLGIAIYDINKNNFVQFKPEVLGDIQFECMTKTDKKLWFSSSAMVFCYNLKNDSLYSFSKIPEMTNINFVKADSKDRVWIGDCYNGLCCFDEDNDKIKFFRQDSGFPVSWMFSLEEGSDGWFWASSDKGLVKFYPEKGEHVLYDNNSGMPFNQFNYRASYTNSNGDIYFGGNNGMVSFNEKNNPQIDKEIEVVFTGMQLFNKSLQPGSDSPLKKSINKIDEVVLNYSQNVFTVEYAALSYSLSGKCQYAYYLEGFEESWNYVGNRDFATYTNLSPGSYYFHVKSSTSNIQAEVSEKVLHIVVRPPFYLSKWAFLVYFISAWLFSYILYRVGKNFEKSKALVVMERREKEHADEIHKVKLEFFTNISHELKTPLTLILGPISKIIQEDKLSPISRKRLLGIEKNAKRLFQLINQLLEFRKIENGKESLHIVQTNIFSVTDEIVKSFDNIVESKDIDFRVHLLEKKALVWIDKCKVDNIIYNLLSNAFKFTKEGGKITLKVDVQKREGRFRKEKQDLVVSVSDTGKGIKPELVDKVFDRFFHIEDNENNHSGSGIGLAYVKSLVMLHKGLINVESEVGKGSTFTVTLPVSETDYDDAEILRETVQYIPAINPRELFIDAESEMEIKDLDGVSHKPLILLIEDNVELIEFMKESLELKYHIVTALNGNVAFEKMKKVTPDLIISDVMMPGLDGFEFTRLIKGDLNTSHIPIILLTAKSGTDNRLEGLNTGADYYIEKPFILNMLEKNIENILNTRRKLIERFKKDAFISVCDVAVSESDKLFMEKLTAIIKNSISDSSMDVTFIVKEMGLSRSLLHMKLKGLVNCSTTEFIRAVRIKEAVKLIANGKCNISEAAYETGFSSPTYFTRRFKEFYGKSPREYFHLKN